MKLNKIIEINQSYGFLLDIAINRTILSSSIEVIRYSLKNNWLTHVLFKKDSKLYHYRSNRDSLILGGNILYPNSNIELKNQIRNMIPEIRITSNLQINEIVYVFNEGIPYKGIVSDIEYCEYKNNKDEAISSLLYIVKFKKEKNTNYTNKVYSFDEIFKTKESILAKLSKMLD